MERVLGVAWVPAPPLGGVILGRTGGGDKLPAVHERGASAIWTVSKAWNGDTAVRGITKDVNRSAHGEEGLSGEGERPAEHAFFFNPTECTALHSHGTYCTAVSGMTVMDKKRDREGTGRCPATTNGACGAPCERRTSGADDENMRTVH